MTTGVVMGSVLKSYWVTLTGTLSNDVGALDQADPTLKVFLAEVTRQLLVDDLARNPAVLTYGDGRVVLTTALQAPSGGYALDCARAAFMGAIERAGGSSHIPDGTHRAWQITQLLRFDATVREVDTDEASAEVA